ncbi:MAG: beta-ketoacyl synthase chain length factor [Ferruginibacter sp.]|nr:hypothetical protein [Ferruginibacter sp.]
MFYIHSSSCIWAQQFLFDDVATNLQEPVEKKMYAVEPSYSNIPPAILRRMGKAVRLTVGAAIPLVENNEKPNGIIIGTTNAGKDDCVKFLNQILEYNEGMLTPMNFVQSTPNAPAAQIGLLTKNYGYNITHSQLGLSFEYAILDADMMLEENPTHNYILGAVDELSEYNFIFQEKLGTYKNENTTLAQLYNSNTKGCIAGEGAAIFYVNKNKIGATAKLVGIDTLHTEDENILQEKFILFLNTNKINSNDIDLFLSGENGDNRLDKFYNIITDNISNNSTTARYKHLSGDFPTATSIALWLASNIVHTQVLPSILINKDCKKSVYKNILIYNNYNGLQHSFMLVSVVG